MLGVCMHVCMHACMNMKVCTYMSLHYANISMLYYDFIILG